MPGRGDLHLFLLRGSGRSRRSPCGGRRLATAQSPVPGEIAGAGAEPSPAQGPGGGRAVARHGSASRPQPPAQGPPCGTARPGARPVPRRLFPVLALRRGTPAPSGPGSEPGGVSGGRGLCRVSDGPGPRASCIDVHRRPPRRRGGHPAMCPPISPISPSECVCKGFSRVLSSSRRRPRQRKQPVRADGVRPVMTDVFVTASANCCVTSMKRLATSSGPWTRHGADDGSGRKNARTARPRHCGYGRL